MSGDYTIFDKEYDREKTAEGMAIAECVLYGKCDICPAVAVCSTDEEFKFPKDAACMVIKQEILRSWQKDGGQVDE